jgi:Ca2+-binding EF-hand superfamily protein
MNLRSDEELRALFDMCDTDGDGVITEEELRKNLEVGTDPESLEIYNKILKLIESDDDSQITYEEFCKAERLKVLWPSFNALDADGDGYIAYDEFYNLLRSVSTQEEIVSIFNSCDKNSDGKISFEGT